MVASIANIKSVVFDWDGTLVNTMRLKVCNAARVFAENYQVQPELAIESYRKYSGISRKELFQFIAQECAGKTLSDFEFTRLSNLFTKYNLQSYQENHVFHENNRDTLAWLKEQGFLLFVSSSAIQEEIEALADSLQVRSFFTEILGSKGKFKKGKSHIDYIKDRYQLNTNQMLFVGDEKADVRLMGRLGMTSIGITRYHEHDPRLLAEFADHMLSDLSELKGLLTHV